MPELNQAIVPLTNPSAGKVTFVYPAATGAAPGVQPVQFGLPILNGWVDVRQANLVTFKIKCTGGTSFTARPVGTFDPLVAPPATASTGQFFLVNYRLADTAFATGYASAVSAAIPAGQHLAFFLDPSDNHQFVSVEIASPIGSPNAELMVFGQ